MCDRCQALEKELQTLKKELEGKPVLDMDFYHSLLYDAGIITKAVEPGKPSFKTNKKLGEGEASKDELKYRQELQNLLKELYEDVNSVDTTRDEETVESEINEFIENFIKEGQALAGKHINHIYDKNLQNAIKKLKKLGIKNPKVPKSQPARDALLNWQQFAIVKIGTQIQLDLKNERLGRNYFEAAYGSKKKPG
ncbi:hypothetical protein [Methanobacterium ferruginis]|uniref:hypothetical protein n=1 Tax=Methanobacterium ferruginis TaxID=710191 RepID=UPI0025725E0A|nr:hypothetical protein [Methanobacterium ferruginis]BDZ68588.1 hypothetical protein GCM10025860_20360 [Methanobacterium ferruginis]